MYVRDGRTVYLTPADDAQGALLETLARARTSIDLLIYALTLPPLVDLLLVKAAEGVRVRVVADHSQAQGHPERAQLLRLQRAGIAVTLTQSPGGYIMHQKVAVVDGTIACYGSFNFSMSAQHQLNTFVVEDDLDLAALFLEQLVASEAYGRAHVLQLAAPPSGAWRLATGLLRLLGPRFL